MRIRNRPVPFRLLPVTNSDPNNLINRSPVMVQLNDATTKPSCTHGPLPVADRPQPSDQPLPPIGKPSNGSDASSVEGGARRSHHRRQETLVEDEWEEERGQKGNDSRKGSISFNLESPHEGFSPSNPSKQDGRWCEGEKAFPFKKRRGSFDSAKEEDDNKNNDTNSKKKMKTRKMMKTRMNKKCVVQGDASEGEEEEEENEEGKEESVMKEMKPQAVNNVGHKKKARGGALMEGSRCSRVNGRGWRCCQQTLVGYSLCEHHLGKGRLRSMTSVRNKSLGTSTPKNNNTTITNNLKLSEPTTFDQKQASTKGSDGVSDDVSLLGNDDDGDEDYNDEKKPPMVTTKKRMKLGMVKARSISSLLGQTNNNEIVAVVDDDSNNK